MLFNTDKCQTFFIAFLDVLKKFSTLKNIFNAFIFLQRLYI